MKILFLARSLNTGGAERQLVTTAKGLAERGHRVSIMVFYAGETLESDLENTGVAVLNLNKKGRWDLFAFILRLIRQSKANSPDVIYSFMSGANIFAVIIKPFLYKTRIIWGVRASNMDLEQYNWLLLLNYKIECYLSRFADGVISNSRSGCEYAKINGFPGNNIYVIPNGIDTDRFRPDQAARTNLRKEWGIHDSETLIGLIARLDPMKDHQNFLHAAKLSSDQRKEIRFVCIGGGSDQYSAGLKLLATNLGLDSVLLWAGERHDMVSVYNALDIVTLSSSFGEGFPNVIGEAMACGKPCVVTDVGDSGLVVGDQGMVVPAGDPVRLATSLMELVTGKVSFDTISIRGRIVSNFNIEKLVNNTEKVLVS